MKFCFLAGLLLFALPAFATTYYVDGTRGSNANSCMASQTVTTAKATINASAACLSGGDTMLVRAGTYTESIDNGGTPVIPSGATSFAGATVVQNYPGESPTLNGCIYMASQSFIIFSGINLNGTGVNSCSGDGVFTINGSDHIRLTNAEVQQCFHQCILMGDNNGVYGNIEVTFVHVHNSGTAGAGLPAKHGIYISGGVQSSNSGPVLINNVESYNNVATNASSVSYGVVAYDSNTSHTINVTVTDCSLHDNGGGLDLAGGTGMIAFNNIIWHNVSGASAPGNGIDVNFGITSGAQVYQNTIFNNAGFAVSVGGGASGTIVRNNIFNSNGSNSIQNLNSSTITQSNNFTGAAGFVNSGSTPPDLHLTSGSGARGFGTDLSGTGISGISTDKDGVNTRPPWDAGAYVFGALAPTTTVLVSSLNPSMNGQNVQFRATVSATGGTPTGTVTFKDGMATLSTQGLNGSGVTIYATASLNVGTHPISAVYNGDSSFGSSTSNTVNQVVTPGSPQTFYVSTTGSDANSCSAATQAATPKQHFSSVLTCVTATEGDTVIASTGNYSESLINTIPAGASGLPTIIRAQNNRGATILGAIALNGSFITIDGLTVNAASVTTGIVINYGAQNHITIQNATVENGNGVMNGSHCISGAAGASNITVLRNLISGCNGGAGSFDEGVKIFGANDIVDGNTISGMTASGVYAFNQGNGGINSAIIRNNNISSNGCSGMFLSDGTGFVVYNNILNANGTNAGCTGNRNGIWHSISGTSTIANNVAYGNPGTGILVDGGLTSTVENNIANANTTAQITGGTTVSNNTTATASFVAPGSDFHLQMGSVAIAAGLNLTATLPTNTDFTGLTRPASPTLWDNGVYNFITTSVPQPLPCNCVAQ